MSDTYHLKQNEKYLPQSVYLTWLSPLRIKGALVTKEAAGIWAEKEAQHIKDLIRCLFLEEFELEKLRFTSDQPRS